MDLDRNRPEFLATEPRYDSLHDARRKTIEDFHKVLTNRKGPMGSEQSRPPRVLVVGAGISGLAFTHYLRRLAREYGLTIQVRVLEASTRPGGRVYTFDEGGFRVEAGANGVLGSKPAAVALAYDLGLGDEVIRANPVARNRFIFHRGALHALPISLSSFVRSRLLSTEAKLRLLAEPFIPRTPANVDWSVHRWAARRLGTEVARVLIDALCTGIFAAPPDVLSVRAAFPRLWELEQRGGSLVGGAISLMFRGQKERPAYEASLPPDFPRRGLWSFRRGLGTLTTALAQSVGNNLFCGARVLQVGKRAGRWVAVAEGQEKSYEADWLVLAVEAFEAARLLAMQLPDAARELSAIRYVPIVVAALGCRRESLAHPLNGFGFLVPSRERRHLLGVLWSSSVFPDRAPEGHVLLRAMLGGYGDAQILSFSDEEILRVLQEELRRTMGVEASPVYRKIIRWPRAIPLPEPGHLDRIARIEHALQSEQQLVLLGNYRSGVSVNDCVDLAYREAARVARAIAFSHRHSDTISTVAGV